MVVVLPPFDDTFSCGISYNTHSLSGFSVQVVEQLGLSVRKHICHIRDLANAHSLVISVNALFSLSLYFSNFCLIICFKLCEKKPLLVKDRNFMCDICNYDPFFRLPEQAILNHRFEFVQYLVIKFMTKTQCDNFRMNNHHKTYYIT